MSELFLQKKELIFQVYDKARKTTTETSFSGILKNLEYVLLDDFNIPLSYRTFETYYKNLVEGNRDYKIKAAILNDLSKYLGYSDFKEFCEENPIKHQATKVKVIIDGAEKTSKEIRSFSDIIINSPVFTIPEFISKHSNSFGLIGILLVAGFLFKQNESYFGFNRKEETKRINTFVSMEEKNQETTRRPVPILDIPENTVNKSIQIRKKECIVKSE